MKRPPISSKRLAIDKASAQTVTVMAVAAFLTVFSLVAAQSLWSQRGYYSRVTKDKETANKQLQEDITAAGKLSDAYKTFIDTPTNVIGGDPQGTGDRDGDNAKIVLDALPPQYDFPALASSLEKILTDRHLTGNMSGTDDQIAQQENQSSVSPEAIDMPFNLSVTNANYSSVQSLTETLQASIRPIAIDTLTLSGSANKMQVSITAHTYYQPGKEFKITTKVDK